MITASIGVEMVTQRPGQEKGAVIICMPRSRLLRCTDGSHFLGGEFMILGWKETLNQRRPGPLSWKKTMKVLNNGKENNVVRKTTTSDSKREIVGVFGPEARINPIWLWLGRLARHGLIFSCNSPLMLPQFSVV